MSIVVVMPSRGRPERARQAIDAIRQTAVLVDTTVALVVDADDPALPEYRSLRFGFGPEVNVITLGGEDTGNLVRATNTASLRIAQADPDCIIGNLGDDHMARTPGWDLAITNALRESGIAYGDDLVHGPELPTAPFISASIVNALGWYALPTCRHLYIDNVWKVLGEQLGVLRYLPDVVFEHCHPAVGKGEWDDGYRQANSDETTEHDRAAFNQWWERWAMLDVAAVRAAA